MLKRVVLMPLYIILCAARIAVNLIDRLSSWIFYVLGVLFLLTTVCCYYMEIESGAGLRHMIIGCGAMFIIPAVISTASGVMEVLVEIIRDQLNFS